MWAATTPIARRLWDVPPLFYCEAINLPNSFSDNGLLHVDFENSAGAVRDLSVDSNKLDFLLLGWKELIPFGVKELERYVDLLTASHRFRMKEVELVVNCQVDVLPLIGSWVF